MAFNSYGRKWSIFLCRNRLIVLFSFHLPKFLSMSKPTPTLLRPKGFIIVLKSFKQIEHSKKTNHEEKSLHEGKIANLSLQSIFVILSLLNSTFC